MALLDDSVVNISTIAGSRHVGPIKPRVEDWQKQLALFADTLVCAIVLASYKYLVYTLVFSMFKLVYTMFKLVCSILLLVCTLVCTMLILATLYPNLVSSLIVNLSILKFRAVRFTITCVSFLISLYNA